MEVGVITNSPSQVYTLVYSQSLTIATDLSFDESVKIVNIDLINVHCIDQSD